MQVPDHIFFICVVCVCMVWCVVCILVSVSVSVCTCMCLWNSVQCAGLSILPPLTSILTFESGSHLGNGAHRFSRSWMASELQWLAIVCPHFTSSGIIESYHYSQLGCGELNSDLSVCAVGSLVTEPSPLFLMAALRPCCLTSKEAMAMYKQGQSIIQRYKFNLS